jgi:hypothetical protein
MVGITGPVAYALGSAVLWNLELYLAVIIGR